MSHEDNAQRLLLLVMKTPNFCMPRNLWVLRIFRISVTNSVCSPCCLKIYSLGIELQARRARRYYSKLLSELELLYLRRLRQH